MTAIVLVCYLIGLIALGQLLPRFLLRMLRRLRR